MANKKVPQTLKGFRDFLPEQVKLRRQVVNLLEQTFSLYGFEPMETPALEYAELLLNKYGAEADKLVYSFEDRGGRQIALKYDITVPTARVISQYKDQLPFPFRRYQIQPVWRAEKPQAGRFREFLQCDIDIFGTASYLAEAEIMTVTAACLANLGLKDYKILINDRSILFELMSKSQIESERQLAVIRTLDKLDKKSQEEVEKELSDLGLKNDQISALFDNLDSATPSAELKAVIGAAIALGIPEEKIVFTPTLSRGLDYYTGTIFEVKLDGYSAGSVAGGGRYDQLIEDLSGVEMPAVGLSFGFDRLIEAISQLNIETEKETVNNVLVTIFDDDLISASLKTAKSLRQAVISCEVYPDPTAKLERQLKYADKKGFQYVIIIGPEEVKQNQVVLKNLISGEQTTLSIDDVIKKLTS